MIQIKWSEIKKDVDKQTWRLAKVHISDAELRNDAQEDSSKMSETFILRFAESGIAMVGVALKDKLQSSSDAISTDELDTSLTEWDYTFKDSLGIDERKVAILIHKFVVLYCLYRWAMIYMMELVSQFYKEMTDTLADIDSSVFSMSTPRKKTYPSEYETENPTEIEYECR